MYLLDDEAEEVSDATAEREGEDEERELHELFGDSLHGPIHDLDEFDDDNDVDDDSEGSLADFIVRSSEESSEESTYDPGDEDLGNNKTCIREIVLYQFKLNTF